MKNKLVLWMPLVCMGVSFAQEVTYRKAEVVAQSTPWSRDPKGGHRDVGIVDYKGIPIQGHLVWDGAAQTGLMQVNGGPAAIVYLPKSGSIVVFYDLSQSRDESKMKWISAEPLVSFSAKIGGTSPTVLLASENCPVFALKTGDQYLVYRYQEATPNGTAPRLIASTYNGNPFLNPSTPEASELICLLSNAWGRP